MKRSNLILLLFFSQYTALHKCAYYGHVETCRFLVEWKADVAARDKCFSPPPSHHLSLTICFSAMVGLHLTLPSTTTNPTWLHTCAASAAASDDEVETRCFRASLLNSFEDAALCRSEDSRRRCRPAVGRSTQWWARVHGTYLWRKGCESTFYSP
jgi:hypothetical protein